MAPQFPSIQSFFGREPFLRTQKPATSSPAPEPDEPLSSSPGDGFSASDIDAVLHPGGLPKWTPPTEYPEVEIGALAPGPRCVTVMGRIVNFYDRVNGSKMPRAAKGCLRCVVGDGTGFVVVKLWYGKIDYKLRLGHLVTVWTPHVSNAEAGSVANRNGAALTMSVFPERDHSCYFMVQERSDDGVLFKTPLGYREGSAMDGLMTLKSFVEGGSEVADGKILVAVKSIGGRKKFTTKKGNPAEKVEVHVFDDTADATLTLWGCVAGSASAWKPSSTVLLLSNPALKEYTRPILSLTAETHVEIDPAITDAEWLRKYARNLTKREHVNPPYPENVFDIEQFKQSQLRMLFTLADIDEFARAAPTEIFMGYFSLLITELHIMTFHQRNMLFGTECCGVPLFANATSTKCKQCENDVALSINPRIIGPLTDETGHLGTGKLIWSPQAWSQLLGRTASEFVAASTDVLKYLEHRLLFMRVTVLFGWSGEMGKLCVCEISA